MAKAKKWQILLILLLIIDGIVFLGMGLSIYATMGEGIGLYLVILGIILLSLGICCLLLIMKKASKSEKMESKALDISDF